MHDDQEYVRLALRGGASGYVTKRTAGQDLVEAIRVVNLGRSYIRVTLSEEGLANVVDDAPSRRRRPDPRALLSTRELQVLRLLAHGYSNREIAIELGLSTKSVDTYRARLQVKLDLKGRVSLVRCAIDAGLLDSSDSSNSPS
jgi:DNA-binding NarL/FixJ family response regulator